MQLRKLAVVADTHDDAFFFLLISLRHGSIGSFAGSGRFPAVCIGTVRRAGSCLASTVMAGSFA
jgi:hypothetical protein